MRRGMFSFKLGATPTGEGVHFALFSTRARSAAVRLFDPATQTATATIPLRSTVPHRFEGDVPGIGPGALYKFVLDDRELPDPYARFLPHGVHGPARVEPISPRHENHFVASPLQRWVIYELHVGSFTPEGTFRAVTEKLDYLSKLGINAIELMPVAAFAGRRGWGYDGVALYAPFAGYGEPDDLRELVRQAHARGIAVLLDVVYNHFGPAGNYLSSYSDLYFTDAHETAWGDAPNYGDRVMRELVLDNARYWLDEFDFDGLRLDATHAILDESKPHLLAELARLAHAFERPRVVIAEDERNDPMLVETYGLDGVWADDFHHVLHVTLTAERDGYYAAYEGGAAELARTIERGWLYEGQVYPPTDEPRGRPATLPHERLVYCVQNHDQIGNRALGDRLVLPPGAALLLLFLPSIPLLFMGQEWAASSPFLFFSDHEPELGAAVTRGRREEFKRFRAFQDPELRERIPDPQAASTFERSKLLWEECASGAHAETLALYVKMLHLRATDPVLAGRTTLRATAEGGLLVVTRESEEGRRVLLFNGTSARVNDPRLAEGEILLATSEVEKQTLAPWSAAVMRG